MLSLNDYMGYTEQLSVQVESFAKVAAQIYEADEAETKLSVYIAQTVFKLDDLNPNLNTSHHVAGRVFRVLGHTAHTTIRDVARELLRRSDIN